MDTRLYPQGKTTHYSKYVAGVLKFFRRSDASEFFAIDGTAAQIYVPNAARAVRVRASAAEVNAGKTVVAAVPRYQHRVIDCTMIAIGGNAATATSVDLAGTRAASAVLLVVNGVAALTRSARVSMGEPPAAGASTILVDGASFTALDANTGITVQKQTGGGALGTASHVDVILTYATDRV
jgi:hypothetical protein